MSIEGFIINENVVKYDYDELADKPSIPTQTVIDATLSIQGDAADAKATGDTLSDVKNAVGSFPVSKTGTTISFTDGKGNAKIGGLSATFKPSQSGTGTPSESNVRTISGYTGITVTQTGGEPSTTETHSISWQNTAGTIYGGHLDVSFTGGAKVTAEYGVVDLSLLSWTTKYTGTTNKTLQAEFSQTITQGRYPSYLNRSNWMLEKYKYRSSVNTGSSMSNPDGKNVGLYFYLGSSATTDKVTTFYLVLPVGSSPSGKFVFKIASTADSSPEYSLSDVSITTFEGNNTFTSDAESMSLTYYADGKSYVDSAISELEETAEETYVKKENFYQRGPAFFGDLPNIYSIDPVDYADANTVSDLYDKFDAFLSIDGVSKNLLGYATAADGTQDTTLPIYEYAVNRSLEDTAYNYHSPLIMISALIHGNERVVGVQLYNFFASLFDENNTYRTWLTRNFRFKFVPIVNPWGYNNNSRYNARGVNLNRNFSYRWSLSEESGSAPYSEYETQALKAWIEANTDAMFELDLHTYSVDSNALQTRSYIASNCKFHRACWTAFYKGYMYPYYHDAYGYYMNASHMVEANNIPGLSAECFSVNGIDSSILEFPGGDFSIHCIRNTTVMCSYLMTLIKEYRIG